jgi:small-conductance mechanosensitive channel
MNIDSLIEKFPYLQDHVWIEFFLLLALYALAAVAIDFFINRVLKRLTRLTKSSFDNDLIKYLHAPVYWTVLLVGLIHCFSLIELSESVSATISRSGRSLILIIWLTTVIRIINFIAKHTKNIWLGKIGKDLGALIHKLIFLVMLFVGAYWLLDIWNVSLTPFFASAGIVGIAVALAAKDTLSNFFGGMSLFMDRVFKVGDYIIVDNQERGEVVEIGIRSSRVLTRDDVLVTIPNSILANSKIINESAPTPNFRIKIPVGVAYGSDLDRVEEVLLRIATESEGISKEPAPRVRVRSLASSSVDFELLVWVDDPRDRGLQTHLFLKKIHKTLQEENITIPFPQMDVHFDRLDGKEA